MFLDVFLYMYFQYHKFCNDTISIDFNSQMYVIHMMQYHMPTLIWINILVLPLYKLIM